MSTITRELAKLFRKITNSEIDAEGNAHVVLSPADSLLINNARIALASLEAEAVAYIIQDAQARGRGWPGFLSFDASISDEDINEYEISVTPLYTAPQLPQPAVPDIATVETTCPDVQTNWQDAKMYAEGWNACRAAMLQGSQPVTTAYKLPEPIKDNRLNSGPEADDYYSGYQAGWNELLEAVSGNSPVITDDVRRMDWLVSKTVDVREPMVYGSHSLFWSQTITDEEDEYHATKLREQIDAAMEAEQAAAPQQEVK